MRIPWSPELKNILTIMTPMLLASSSGQINIFINTNLATTLQEGAISWLNLSFRLAHLPVGIIAVAIGTAALPDLSKALSHSGGVINKVVSHKLQNALELMLWLIVPSTCFILINCLPIVQLIYQHGLFKEQASIATSEALYNYSFILLGYGMIKVLTSFYYSIERTKFAMQVSLFCILVNAIVNYFLVDQYGFKGLALGSSLVISVNGVILLLGLKQECIQWNRDSIIKSAIRLSIGFTISFIVQRYMLVNVYDQLLLINVESLKLRSLFQILMNGLIVFIIFSLLFMTHSDHPLYAFLKKRRT